MPFGIQVVMYLCRQLIALAQVEEGCENVYPHLPLELGVDLLYSFSLRLNQTLTYVWLKYYSCGSEKIALTFSQRFLLIIVEPCTKLIRFSKLTI